MSSPRLIPPDYSYYFSIDGELFLEIAPLIPGLPLDLSYLKYLKGTERVFGGAEIKDDGNIDFVLTLQGDFSDGLIRTGLRAGRGWEKIKGEEKYWRDTGGMEIAPFNSRSIYMASGRMDDVISLYVASEEELDRLENESGPGLAHATLRDLETGDFVFLGEGDSFLREATLRGMFFNLEINPRALREWSLVLNKTHGAYAGFLFLTFADVRQARAFVTSYRLLGMSGSGDTGRPAGTGQELESKVLDGSAERRENRVYIRDIDLSQEELAGFAAVLF